MYLLIEILLVHRSINPIFVSRYLYVSPPKRSKRNNLHVYGGVAWQDVACHGTNGNVFLQIYSNITLIQNCYWFVDEKATNRLNDSPSAVQTFLPLFIFQQIPEVLFLKGQNNFMGEGFGPRAKQKIAKALWQRCR